MAAPLIALAVASGAVAAYASIQESEARAEQARREASLKRLQAEETLARMEINTDLMKRQGKRLEGSQVAQFGAFNVSIGAAGYGLLSETQRTVQEQIDLMRRDARFRAEMLRQGAKSSDVLAQDITNAGYWNAFGSLLGAGSRAAAVSGGTSKPATYPSIE